jgi:hypothetical protein
MTRFDKWLARSKWVLLPAIYVIVCVWTYFGTTVSIQGVELPQHDAGVYGVIGLHVMAFLATVGAYLLHWIVELISKLWGRKKK